MRKYINTQLVCYVLLLALSFLSGVFFQRSLTQDEVALTRLLDQAKKESADFEQRVMRLTESIKIVRDVIDLDRAERQVLHKRVDALQQQSDSLSNEIGEQREVLNQSRN